MIRRNGPGRKYFLLLSFLAILVFSLSLHSNQEKEVLNSSLLAEELLEREAPFVEREFDPYLNDRWIGNAVSYGPYRKGQAPGGVGPSQENIIEDLKIVSQYWNLIRVYNADDDSELLLSVIREHNFPIKVMLGVWLENEDNNAKKKAVNITNALRAVELANEYSDIIAAVNVGNETQVFWSWHKMAADDLIRYIRFVRTHVEVPVSTADDYNFWNKPESQAVAEELDFIVTHIYPLWNGKTLDESIPWLNENYNFLKKFHPGKKIILGEIGWATQYNPAKKGPDEQGTLIKGDVSLEAQFKFLIELDNWITSYQVPTFLFEAFDEPWKGGGEETEANEIEKNWGVFYADRQAKESFQNYLNYKKQTQTQ